MTDRALAYARRGHRAVRGWLITIAAEVLVELAACQRRRGIHGPVCEIGVHHGKLFILLHLLTDGSEISAAWDLFERQRENVDGSGRGDREIFERNLARHGCDMGRIRICTENSLRLTPDRVVDECGGQVRLFSIDGGHTAEIARNDLALAEQSLRPGGIVIVDDFFNEAWPGVAEGVCRHFISGGTGLVPVAIAGNKLFLTNDRQLAKGYLEAIRTPRAGFDHKRSVAFGSEVLILTPVERTLRSYLGNTPIGKAIRRRLWR